SSSSSQNDLFPEPPSPSARSYRHLQAQTRTILSFKTRHLIVLALVTLGVASIVADIVVALVACDLNEESAKRVTETRKWLPVFGTVVSSPLVVSLAGCHGYLASFAVDVVIKEIAELIIVLRLYRLIEIIEEL
ncbi:hypothetical protein QR685DRAFT_444156, partial [Neurospora intermedia]